MEKCNAQPQPQTPTPTPKLDPKPTTPTLNINIKHCDDIFEMVEPKTFDNTHTHTQVEHSNKQLSLDPNSHPNAHKI